jgi:hypothetical protein
MAFMLSTFTEKETTLASGASVPTTNAGPVSAVMVDEPVELVKALVQPAISNAAAVNETNAIGKDLTSVLESITITPLSALEPFRAFWSTNAEQTNSLASRTSNIAGLLCRERGAQNQAARLPAVSERTWAKCYWARSGGHCRQKYQVRDGWALDSAGSAHRVSASHQMQKHFDSRKVARIGIYFFVDSGSGAGPYRNCPLRGGQQVA